MVSPLTMKNYCCTLTVTFYCRCAHCKSFEPIILELGKVYANDPLIKLYRIDGSKNEVSINKVRIRGYPTFYLFPSNKKEEPIEYEGDRTIEGITLFLAVYRNSKIYKSVSHSDDTSNSEDEVIDLDHDGSDGISNSKSNSSGDSDGQTLLTDDNEIDETMKDEVETTTEPEL